MNTPSSPHPATGPVHLLTAESLTPEFPKNSPVAKEIRHLMIAEAAYYRAEARGFADGYELDDWLEAEAEIDQTILPSALGPLQD